TTQQPPQATLNIASAAGFGTAGVLTGYINLSGNSLLEFGSGEITSISSASNSELILNGPNARVSDASNTTTNSALTGLTSIGGRLFLYNGAAIAPSGNLTVTGELHVDDSGSDGSTVSIGGTLSNSNYVVIGTGGMSAPTTVTAVALSNASN